MAKKVKIDVDFGQDNILIGISCHKKDYWLAYNLNERLNFKLKRIDDLPCYNENLKTLIKYSLFYYYDDNALFSYYLFANHHPEGKLFPSQKTTDYFLLMNGRVTSKEIAEIVTKLKRIQNILTAFSIDFCKLKGMDNFLSDLELHMIECSKSKK